MNNKKEVFWWWPLEVHNSNSVDSHFEKKTFPRLLRFLTTLVKFQLFYMHRIFYYLPLWTPQCVITSRSSAVSVLKRPIASFMMSVSSRSGWSAVILFLFSSSQSWKPVFGLNAHSQHYNQVNWPCTFQRSHFEEFQKFYLLFSVLSSGEAGGGTSGCFCWSAAGWMFSWVFLLAALEPVICSRVDWVWREEK